MTRWTLENAELLVDLMNLDTFEALAVPSDYTDTRIGAKRVTVDVHRRNGGERVFQCRQTLVSLPKDARGAEIWVRGRPWLKYDFDPADIEDADSVTLDITLPLLIATPQ